MAASKSTSSKARSERDRTAKARSRSAAKKAPGRIFVWLRRLVVLAILLGLTGYFVVAHFRPPLRDGEVYGIDVSNHQGDIDWDAVADDNISFAYIKATEGGDFVDSRFGLNWDQAGAAGLERGPYHFFTACTLGSLQADNFLRFAPPDKTSLPPAVDLEMGGNCVNYPSADVVANELDIFLRLIEEAWGRKPLIYMMDGWEEQFPTDHRLDHDMWRRGLPFRPSEDWFIWQLPPYAKVNGVNGRVDLNVMAAPDS